MSFGTTVESSIHTTPEAPDLYRALARMRDDHVDFVAMEVSSHALALNRVDGARFSAAAFLNLSRDHLDFHESEEAYFEAKARLFRGLGPEQVAVLPANADWAERLNAETEARIVTFGRSDGADVELRKSHISDNPEIYQARVQFVF